MKINGILLFITIHAVFLSIASLRTANAHEHWQQDIKLPNNNKNICSDEKDCHVSESCRETKCVNVCINQTCGLNEGCQLNNEHSFFCSCLPNYYRNYTTNECMSKPKWIKFTPKLINDPRLVHTDQNVNDTSFVARLSTGLGEILPGDAVVIRKIICIRLTTSYFKVYLGTEVLLIEFGRYNWIPLSDGKLPYNAIVGGKLGTGEKLYICRVKHLGKYLVTMMQPRDKSCRYKSGAKDIFAKNYDILVAEI